jgi:hypothetical protein
MMSWVAALLIIWAISAALTLILLLDMEEADWMPASYLKPIPWLIRVAVLWVYPYLLIAVFAEDGWKQMRRDAKHIWRVIWWGYPA